LDHVLSIVDGFKATGAVVAACRLELFDLLGARSQTAAELAEGQGWNQDNTERISNAMVALGLLKKIQGKYTVSESGCFLKKEGEVSVWTYATSLDRFQKGLSNISEEVKTGKHQSDAYPKHVVVHKVDDKATKTEQKEETKPASSLSVFDRYKMYDGTARPHARALVTKFDLSSYQKVVDLGGGTGVLSWEVSRVYPNLQVTLFEVPPVIELVKEHFIPHNETLNVSLVAGDFFVDDIPEGDLYILAKVVHDWSTEQAKTLLQKISNKLKSGGGLLLMEKCMSEDKSGPVSAHVWDLMVMAGNAGRIRSGGEYTDMLMSAGFTTVTIAKSQEPCPYDIMYAVKG